MILVVQRNGMVFTHNIAFIEKCLYPTISAKRILASSKASISLPLFSLIFETMDSGRMLSRNNQSLIACLRYKFKNEFYTAAFLILFFVSSHESFHPWQNQRGEILSCTDLLLLFDCWIFKYDYIPFFKEYLKNFTQNVKVPYSPLDLKCSHECK